MKCKNCGEEIKLAIKPDGTTALGTWIHTETGYMMCSRTYAEPLDD